MSDTSHLTPAARSLALRPRCPPDREIADYCSREGASRLKAKIELYWRERGHEVTVSVFEMGFHPATRSVRFDVRSNLLNGAPPSPCAADQHMGDLSSDETSASTIEEAQHLDR